MIPYAGAKSLGLLEIDHNPLIRLPRVLLPLSSLCSRRITSHTLLSFMRRTRSPEKTGVFCPKRRYPERCLFEKERNAYSVPRILFLPRLRLSTHDRLKRKSISVVQPKYTVYEE